MFKLQGLRLVRRGSDSAELNEILKQIMEVIEKHYDVDVTTPIVFPKIAQMRCVCCCYECGW